MNPPRPDKPQRTALVSAWRREVDTARAARRRGDHELAWAHLERAHIVSQPLALRHTTTHALMLAHGVRQRDRREIAGQLFRIVVAAPGSLTRRYPLGNTGGADVDPFTPMAVPPDLRTLLAPDVAADLAADVTAGPAEPPTWMETVTDATTRLRAAGYSEDWVADEGSLRCLHCATSHDPAQVTIDEIVRFEGPSDPGDETILFALTGPCGHRGLYSAAYGTYTPAADLAVLGALHDRLRPG